MVRRVIEMLYREVRGLHQAAYVLAAFTFGSQLLALVRDRLLADQFGADIELDLYYAAFRIPDLLYVLFASTLSVYVLIPFVASRIRGDNAEDARALLSQIFSVFLVAYVALAGIVFITIPYIHHLIFPGFTEQAEELVVLVRILLLQPLLLGVSSLFGVVTQLGHRFILYAISPLIYNVGIICGITFLYPVFGLSGLAYGVVLGACGHMLVQLPLVRTSSLSFSVSRQISWKLMMQIFVVSVPRALTLALQQIVLLVMFGIASLMTVGSVSVFQFAYNLQSVPLAVIGASYSIAAFPLLADLFTQKKMKEFRFHIVTALRHIIFWSVPIIGLIVVLRAHVVRVVLGTGAFDWGDTRLTAAVLALLAVSLFAQAMNLLMIRAFYASGKTLLPFVVTLCSSIFAVSFTGVLYWLVELNPYLLGGLESLMRVSLVAGSEVMVIGVGYSIAVLLQSLILFLFVSKQFDIAKSPFVMYLAKAVFAACVGASSAYATLNFFATGIRDETFVGILIQGGLGGVMGLLGIVLAYYAVHSPELGEIYKSFQAKIFKTDVVAPQEDVL